MKAVVYTKPGPPEVLQLQEVAKPIPTDTQVLVQVRAASLNALDYSRFRGQLKGEPVPAMTRLMDGRLLKIAGKVLGADIAGRVEAAGAAVTLFRPGDEVFGVSAGSRCGLAEYACAAETGLALKPANLSFDEAAAIPVAALSALQGLRDKGKVQAGHKVLIQGASGGVGTFAVQIAKALGAEVTAVCSARNLDTARAIGADHVIDYAQADFTRQDRRYDLILAINGYHPLLDYRRALQPSGRYVALGGEITQILEALVFGPLLSTFGTKEMSFQGIAKVNQPDLATIRELAAGGKVIPVIDRRYPLSAVAEAMRYAAEGHAQGKVILTVNHDDKYPSIPGSAHTGGNS